MDDISFMQQALQLAQHAESLGEVPVGAVLVQGGEVIGRGWNHPIAASDPSAHAEMVALRDAAAAQRTYRLPETTLYVTLEPCTMCVGAIIHARVKRLVFGAHEPRFGAVESAFKLLSPGMHNHAVEYTSGVLSEECAHLLRSFFARRR